MLQLYKKKIKKSLNIIAFSKVWFFLFFPSFLFQKSNLYISFESCESFSLVVKIIKNCTIDSSIIRKSIKQLVYRSFFFCCYILKTTLMYFPSTYLWCTNILHRLHILNFFLCDCSLIQSINDEMKFNFCHKTQKVQH